MTTPNPQDFIRHHVDTNQIGILINPMPNSTAVDQGYGQIAVYSFNSTPVNGRPDVIMTFDPSAGPQHASLIVNTVTDWLKDHPDLPTDTHVIGTVDIEGLLVGAGNLRAQLIRVDGTDAAQHTHEWGVFQHGPNYMKKAVTHPPIVMIQLSDPNNLLPGEPGFDEAFRDHNFVYFDYTTNRPYKDELVRIREGLWTLDAFEDETLRPTIHEEFVELHEIAKVIAVKYPVNAWIPPWLATLVEMTRDAAKIDFEALRKRNNQLRDMIGTLL